MIGGLAFVPQADSPLSCVLVGLGGGSLISFLHDVWTQMTIEAVELDPSVVDVAKDFFDLDTSSERIKVTVADGLDYIRNQAAQGVKHDVVIIDVDSKDKSVGLSCPPVAFVEPEFLRNISTILKPEGVFLLNLAARDEGVSAGVLERVAAAFPACGTLSLQEEINTVVYAANCSASTAAWRRDNLRHAWTDMEAKVRAVWPDTNVEFAEMMDTVKLPDD